MPLLPRDDILACIELADLADEVLGVRRRGGWPCPAPGHGPQTGKSPPVRVYTTPRGEQRWHCHACGTGGTAIDLLMHTHGLNVRDALETLAARTGVPASASGRVHTREQAPIRPAPVAAPRVPEPDPALEHYVSACEAHLWSPAGERVRAWLAARGLGTAVLRANRVGADPGPARLRRGPGLPRGGVGALLPVLDEHAHAIYAQLRYLQPGPSHPKYANPTSAIARLPTFAAVRTPAEASGNGVIVCEGLPDALSAAQVGARAVAILGAGLSDQRVASELHARFPNNRLVIALDADPAGRAGSRRLLHALREIGHRRTTGLDLPASAEDLNAWLCVHPVRFDRGVRTVISEPGATRRPAIVPPEYHSREPATIAPELDC